MNNPITICATLKDNSAKAITNFADPQPGLRCVSQNKK